MREAAANLGVTSHVIRRLIRDRILPAEQVVRGAPYQIRASDLRDDRVSEALGRNASPRHDPDQSHLPIFADT
jgi:excisionase family DNA binding protein